MNVLRLCWAIQHNNIHNIQQCLQLQTETVMNVCWVIQQSTELSHYRLRQSWMSYASVELYNITTYIIYSNAFNYRLRQSWMSVELYNSQQNCLQLQTETLMNVLRLYGVIQHITMSRNCLHLQTETLMNVWQLITIQPSILVFVIYNLI